MISTKGRYALRIMLDLALNDNGEFITLKDISQRQEITVKYLEQIVSLLTRAGFLRSMRGVGGGYQLTRRPEQYTAGDILRAAEKGLAPIACLNDHPNKCRRSPDCQVLSFWENYDKVINDYIDSVTLADLAENAKRNSDIDYSI
ncbi:MAG: Rrf2 family transcriptional regulator [Erysipelotrichaceae bacterium]|nr:Rrf2 family transcriptional regulator [Erysipelotrichaceae bacterium]